MYEIQVHDDGDTEVRKVPSAYKSQNIVGTYDEAVKELCSYGHEEDRVLAAMALAENDWEWITL